MQLSEGMTGGSGQGVGVGVGLGIGCVSRLFQLWGTNVFLATCGLQMDVLHPYHHREKQGNTATVTSVSQVCPSVHQSSLDPAKNSDGLFRAPSVTPSGAPTQKLAYSVSTAVRHRPKLTFPDIFCSPVANVVLVVTVGDGGEHLRHERCRIPFAVPTFLRFGFLDDAVE